MKYLIIIAASFALSGALIAVDPIGKLAEYNYGQKNTPAN